MKKWYISFPALLVLTVMTTTLLTSPAQALEPSDWLPMLKGNRWVLKSEAKGFEKASVVLDVREAGTDTFRIRFQNPWVSAEWLLEPRQEKIFMLEAALGSTAFPLPPDSLYFDFNAPVGSSWENAIGTIAVLKRNETVTTPAGTFKDCITFVETSKDGNKMYWTFARGTGFVRFGQGPGAFLLSELTLPAAPSISDSEYQKSVPGDRSISFALSANPFANEKFDNESVLKRVMQSREAGISSMYISVKWNDVMKREGNLSSADVKSNFDNASKAGLSDILFTLRVVDTNNKTVPAGLEGETFDSQRMWQALSETIDYLVPLLQGVSRINIGNEIDAYFNNHPKEVNDYVVLFKRARDKFKAMIPGVQIGTTITFGGLSDSGSRNRLKPLIDSSDYISLTYYPLNADFTMRAPSLSEQDFRSMVYMAEELGKTHIVLQEVGYPSGSLNASSPEMQAEFYGDVIRALEESDKFVFVNFFLMSDLPDEMVNDFAKYYKLPDVDRFKSYLQTLGIFDKNGNPKPAWYVLKRELGARVPDKVENVHIISQD